MDGGGNEFDYLIVGAGSAGCVLANRLSADPTVTVCLIEAGPPDRSPFIHVPLGMVRLGTHPTLRWHDVTVPQEHAGGRAILMPHGRTLGGSSAINGMVYMRGHPRDYDEWAAMGNAGWSYDDVLPYFRRSEHNETFRDPKFHGQGGELNVTMPAPLNGMVEVLLAAAQQLQIPLRDDFNGGEQDGFGLRQVTQKNGRRVTAATAFLDPVRGRRNLKVVTGAQAERVIVRDGRAIGVMLVRDDHRELLRARREVVLCAGAISSPLILMRSGLGPASELQRHGVEVVRDLPGVGANLQDHVAAGVKWSSRSARPYGISLRALPAIAWGALEYALFRRGLFTSNIMQAGGFVRTDPALARPDIQFSFMPALRNARGGPTLGHGYLLNAFLLRPKSRGSVRLSGPSLAHAPLIDPKFLSEPDDVAVLLRGVKLARRILAAPAFAPYGKAELSPGPQVSDDRALEQVIRATAATAYHPAGTCRMGDDPQAVVDPQLRVHGVAGLRVADGSVMPTIVGANTNAPIIMIGEKAADLIARQGDHAPAKSRDRDGDSI
ncbi:MAG TPA: GMC family oxidoreductase N-terminal domain-containing protein [Xanthobacteraceae bacterium]|nr:GMC family oxidoreductase N-terminal domain-containing protein [Xanthobacteraceae bacterium]